MPHCTTCKKDKSLEEMKFEKTCISCSNKKKQRNEKNRERNAATNLLYRQNNKSKLAELSKTYYLENKEDIAEYKKLYQKDNVDKLNAYHRQYRKTRSENDPSFKLRRVFSTSIFKAMKANGASKAGLSIANYLPYTIKVLKEHLEKQFEPWMTWENHGAYRSDIWNDSVQITWTWEIDHIIPQSDLPFDNFQHPNFIICWSLKNLRPLSAKQNRLDGSTKIRHKRKHQ